MDGRKLGLLYRGAHDRMRDIDGLQPQEALDELLKFLFVKEYVSEDGGHPLEDRPPDLRRRFLRTIGHLDPWAKRFWQDGELRVSDQTLEYLQLTFANVELFDLGLDVRSTALRTFLTPDVRKGLGIFLTPEDVVRSMVEIVDPKPTDSILDPACGSGTFLVEAAKLLKTPSSVPKTMYGIEKSPRMLLLADLNLGYHQGIRFRRACADALRQLGCPAAPFGLRPQSVDLIITNPPFGVTVTRDTGIPDLFGSDQPCGDRVPSEVLFLILCLRLLRPGGRLGIVLPRSVITNDRLAKERQRIDMLGHLTDIVDLPAETFAVTGTQTTTVAAFFRRHGTGFRPTKTSVRVCPVTNVGVDATGRPRKGSQLPSLAARLRGPAVGGDLRVVTFDDVSTTATLQDAAGFLFRRGARNGHRTLRQFVETANTGRTPGRSAYMESGTFIVKVGNLTGRGIDWAPRDRNFVPVTEGERRAATGRLGLRLGDILLTASAHAAKYIGKKVDIVAAIPDDLQRPGGVTFVGELIRVRPSPDVDPYVLLAALRHPHVREDMQASVRGQTAHLNPADMLEVGVPWDLRSPDEAVLAIASLLRQEARAAFRLNAVSSDIAARLGYRAPR